MSIRSLFKISQRVNHTSQTLRYCEWAGATADSARHIRIVPKNEEPCYHGGIKDLPLCGFNLDLGWDLGEATKDNIMEVLSWHKDNPTHLQGRICVDCAYTAITILNT